MLLDRDLNPRRPVDMQVFKPTSLFTSATWCKRPGVGMVAILVLSGGGAGGNGVVGAVSTAAGGGGGGSSGQSYIELPAALIPEYLRVSVGSGGAAPGGVGRQSYVHINNNNSAAEILVTALPGNGGGNASGATAGTAGTGGSIAGGSVMCLGSIGAGLGGTPSVIAGASGSAGGTTGVGAAISVSGNMAQLKVTGGSGGAGLGASGSSGTAGGSITTSTSTFFYVQPGGLGTATATVPPTNGSNGFAQFAPMGLFMGGSGGGSTHGSATGAGLVGSMGGKGAYGCGGGGGGGALTTSTQGLGGAGGDGLVIIWQW